MRRPSALSLLLAGVLALVLGCAASPRAPTAPPTLASPVRTAIEASSRAPRSGSPCSVTTDDGVSPTYTTNAPLRSVVGRGHRLQGTVRSGRDCSPVAGAVIEIWPEIEGRGHPDEYRATLVTDANGRYSFECPPPEHIHMRISAEGYQTIGNNSYHPNARPQGTFDIVLKPA